LEKTKVDMTVTLIKQEHRYYHRRHHHHHHHHYNKKTANGMKTTGFWMDA